MIQIKFQINVTCQDCSTPQVQIYQTENERFSSRLQGGHTYLITVRAQAGKVSGADSQVVILIPSVLATVKNLRVKAAKLGYKNWGLAVKWGPPKGLSGCFIKVMYIKCFQFVRVHRKFLEIFKDRVISMFRRI